MRSVLRSVPAIPSTEQARFSSAYVRGLCEALRSLGRDPTPVLARAGIEQVDAWFSLAEIDALLVAAVETTGDPAFGLHWGERSPMMQFDLGPSLVASAPTLRRALEAIAQLQLMFANRTQCTFVEGHTRSTFTFDLLAASETGLHVVTELALLSVWRGFRYLGHLGSVRRIHVAYPRPAHGEEYERVFGAKVQFGQARTSIEFASSALDRQAGAHNEVLHHLILEHTADARRQVLNELRLSERVEAFVRSQLPRVPSVDEAARSLAVSARSLRRKLRTEGLSYSDVVDHVQRARAEELLARGTLTVKAIGLEAGFATTSGFHRAYKRWTGENPGARLVPKAK